MATASARPPNSSWAHSPERRLESLPVQPFEDQMQSGYRRGLAPFETQPGSQIAMLPAPLVNGIEAVAVGQHGTDRQG